MFKALAVVSAVALGTSVCGRAWAQQLTLQPLYLQDNPPAATPAAEPAPEPAPKTTLNDALSKWEPTKGLIDNGFDFGGYAEASYTYNTSAPSNDTITGRVFDQDNNRGLINQTVLYAQRLVAPQKDKFDLGFRVEMMYGTDGRYIHSNGLDWYGDASPQLNPEYQVDLTQIYAQFNLPVGNGIVVTAGKFVTLLGSETINPTINALYSHSYLFNFAIPFTETGVIAAYPISEQWTVTGGITRGWDQSTEDNNGAIDFLGQVRWVPDKKWVVIMNGTVGPELAKNNADYQGLLDLVVTWAFADNLSFGFNGDWGFGAGAAADGGYGQWFGAAGYAAYKFDSHFTLNGRLEFFNDDSGARGLGTTVYEVTAGVTITPFPDNRVAQTLKFRPEVRYDWANDPIYDSGTDSTQLTVAFDAIFSF